MHKNTPQTNKFIDTGRRLFPNCITETKTKDGQIQPAIDFDLLPQERSDCLIEGPTERYQLNWPGKHQALLAADLPIRKTLRPRPEESGNFKTTQNLFIEDFKNAAIQIDDRQLSTNIQKVQERQNWPISSHLKPSEGCEYNLNSEFCLNNGNCQNDSVDRLYSSFSRMVDKKITTTRN